MKIRPIQWRKDGFGLKLIDMPARRSVPILGHKPQPSLILRHWQVWVDGPERRCVDRALTKKTALKRIAEIKQRGAPLFT